ncbi:hypothetical protein DCU91_001009 [Salmonella enterica subsp. enterica]|nr:hypothetical protein [Salmonella enterica subsp. enterica]EDU0983568.1 hypothetical protein [Salmonella enterica subsp. enterica]
MHPAHWRHRKSICSSYSFEPLGNTYLANHPGLHMPRAATSWASCLFAVSLWYIMYP